MVELNQDDRRAITLIGYRGAGKTTVGRVLACLLKDTFVDTDERIVTSAGMTIAEIFAKEGETGFRRRESVAVEEAIQQQPRVISVGGGAVLDDANVARLKSVARIVLLDAPPEILWQRISADSQSRQSRPALTSRDGLEEVTEILRMRLPIYRRIADLVVDTSGKTVDLIAGEIAQRLDGHLPHRAESGQSNQP